MYNNINFIQNSISQKHRVRGKRSFFYKLTKFFLFIFITFFVISFLLSSKVIFSQETFGMAVNKLPVVSHIRSILGAEDKLASKDKDRLNFLLMGIGGAGHQGALLTDTMILGSLQLSTKQISLISVPRDLLVKIPDNGWQRINHASAYGDLNNYPGGGSALAAQTFEKAFDIPVDYWIRIDFTGFITLINDIGGIDVYIERAFTDNQFPTDNFKIQTISFKQGREHMDGEKALRFARSRHGNNGEGSDFARSRRQQKILLAIKDKLLSWKTLTNPNRVYKIYENIKNNIQSNIKTSQILEFLNLAKNIKFENIQHHIIDDSPGGLLKSIITEDGAQVLVPKAGDLSELQDFAKNVFVIKEISDNHINLIIANGTQIEGLASYVGANLSSWGFDIKKLTNSTRQDFEKTVIYDLTYGKQKEALKILKERTGANATQKLAEFLKPIIYKTKNTDNKQKIEADFLIVVGYDQKRAIEDLSEWRAKQNRIAAQANQQKEDKTKSEIIKN